MSDLTRQQFGNYRLIRLLGQGGFADTYLGEQIYLRTYAAMKIVQTQLAQDDQGTFFREAQTIAYLRHPNIVRLLDFGVESSRNIPYLVMDYAPNGTLRQRHSRGEVLPVSRVVPYVKQIAAALQYAHDHKVIHRDVKPENMLVGAENEILLADFGIAVVESSRIQTQSTIAGTMNYILLLSRFEASPFLQVTSTRLLWWSMSGCVGRLLSQAPIQKWPSNMSAARRPH